MAIIFKPERITETNRASSTKVHENGELIIATTGSAFGSNRCNIYIGDGTTQLKSLSPCIVGAPPFKWVATSSMGSGTSANITYWDTTSNYYLRLIVITAHMGPSSSQKNIMLTITIPDPISTWDSSSDNKSYRSGYYMNETAGGTVAFKMIKDTSVSTDKKIVITHDAADTYCNKSSANVVITWYARALYQYEKYKTPL